MSGPEVNQRRRFLLIGTTAMGGIGMAAAAVPFVTSLKTHLDLAAHRLDAGQPWETRITCWLLAADWPGGYFCPCHGSKFDLAGRVFKGVPAPLNLVVPPHHYVSKNIVRIGEATYEERMGNFAS